MRKINETREKERGREKDREKINRRQEREERRKGREEKRAHRRGIDHTSMKKGRKASNSSGISSISLLAG